VTVTLIACAAVIAVSVFINWRVRVTSYRTGWLAGEHDGRVTGYRRGRQDAEGKWPDEPPPPEGGDLP